MSVLSMGVLGGLRGFGTGVAQVGNTMMQESLIEARERERLAREEAILNRRAELSPGGVLGGASRGTSGVRRGAGGEAPPLDLNDPNFRAQMAVAGATPRDVIDTGIGMAQGNRPMEQRMGIGDTGAPEQYSAPKYTPGQESQIRAQTQSAFYRAFGLRDPSHAEDVAKAHVQMQGAEMAREYATTGNLPAAEGSLITQGKGVMDATGSSVITGRAAPGSEAEARIGTERARQGLLGAQVTTESAEQAKLRAQAGEAAAHGKKYAAEVTKMSADEIKEERKRINDRLDTLDSQERVLATEAKDDPLGDRAADREARRKRIEKEREKLNIESDALGVRLGGGPKATGPKAPTGPAAANRPPLASFLRR